MVRHADIDRASWPPRSLCLASETCPRRLSIIRRPQTQLIWLVGLALAGLLAEELEALATQDSQPHSAPVKIGQMYKLNTESRFTGVCDDSGCDSTEHAGPVYLDAVLLVRLDAASGYSRHPITIAGNATFVAPVTGTLKFEEFADPPISDEQRKLLKCTNLRWKTKTLDTFSADLIP